MPNAHIAPLLIVDRWLSTGFVRFSNLPVSLWPLCKGRRPLQGVVRLAPFPHIPGGGGATPLSKISKKSAAFTLAQCKYGFLVRADTR